MMTLMVGPASWTWLGRLFVGVCLLLGGVQGGQGADVSGTWVGSWQVGGADEPVCLALISGAGGVFAEMAYREDKEYEIVKGQDVPGGMEFELPDRERGPIHLKVSVNGSSLIGEVLVGGRSGSVSLKKYSWPSSVYRFGKVSDQPKPLRINQASYTDQALAAKIQGSVELDVQVLSNGMVGKDVRVVRGLGLGLDEKAIEAVRTWVFTPPHEDCRPGPRVKINIEFRIP
jgi:TonB family protein